MDPATLAGIIAGFIIIAVVNMLEGGSLGSLFLIGPLLLVFGGTIAVCVASGTLADAKNAAMSLKSAFLDPVPQTQATITQMVSLGETARREGMLALEGRLAEIDDPFMVRGFQLAVDGTDPQEVQDIMHAEMAAKRSDGKQKAKFFTNAGGFAPTIGIIGTVMSLVHVLENLSEPEALGHAIAGAFLATMWGVLSANVIWLPISYRIQRLNDLEIARMNVVTTGLAAIQAGSTPRVIQQRLDAMLADRKEAA